MFLSMPIHLMLSADRTEFDAAAGRSAASTWRRSKEPTALARRRRVGAHQARGLQVAPQRRRDFRADHLRVAANFASLLSAWYHRNDRGVTERKAKRRLRQFDAMRLADRLN